MSILWNIGEIMKRQTAGEWLMDMDKVVVYSLNRKTKQKKPFIPAGYWN